MRHFAFRIVEGIHDQRAAHLDGLFVLAAVKEDAPSETTCGRFPGLLKNGVGPHHRHAIRDLRLGLVFPRKRNLRAPRRRAARCSEQQTKHHERGAANDTIGLHAAHEWLFLKRSLHRHEKHARRQDNEFLLVRLVRRRQTLRFCC